MRATGTLIAFIVSAVFTASAVPACTPQKEAPASSKREACTRVGQNCEVTPGKLGTCVLKEMCTDPPPACFVCQSQH